MRGLLGPLVSVMMVLSTVALAGCLEEKPAATLKNDSAPVPAGNITQSLVLPKGTGAIGHRVCVTSATMCFPSGMGATNVGGASNNPYGFTVNGTVQSAKLLLKWSGSSPASNSNYEAVVTQRAACTGGGGGGGGGGGAPATGEIARKTGTSPLTIDIPEAKWNAANKCLRVQLLLTSRAPSPAFVGASSGDTFTVEGEYVTVIPAPVAKTANAAGAPPK